MPPWHLVPHIYNSHTALTVKLSSDHVTAQLETLQWHKTKTILLPHPTIPLYLQQHEALRSDTLGPHTCSLALCSSHANFLSIPQIHTFCLRAFALAVPSSATVHLLINQLILTYPPRLLQSVQVSDYLLWPPTSWILVNLFYQTLSQSPVCTLLCNDWFWSVPLTINSKKAELLSVLFWLDLQYLGQWLVLHSRYSINMFCRD